MRKKILVFLCFLLFITPVIRTVEAAPVATKVVNETAKKIAKEAIKDTVVDMSFNMVMNYKYVPKDERIEVKQGYELICLPKDKSSDGNCSRPMEIKKNIDKKTVANKVEEKLDAKIAGGVGATKWGKVLDWVAPVFAVGMGVALMDHAINGDVSDFFDEIAMESLVDLELINYHESVNGPSGHILNYYNAYGTKNSYSVNIYFNKKDENKKYVWKKNNTTIPIGVRAKFTKNDENSNWLVSNLGQYFVSDKILELTENTGTLSQGQITTYLNTIGESLSVKEVRDTAPINIPAYNQLNIPRTNPTGKPVRIIAPGAYPFIKTSTKETVYPVRKPDGSIGFKTKTGTDVDPEDVTVMDPVITENPDGSQTVRKAPTWENQNPPESQDEVIPPKNQDPNDVPPTEFPEGETCSANLKKPNLKPLTIAFTTSFPFSIPWDLQRLFESVFGGMESNKPNFKYEYSFMDSKKNWDIKVPDYFDSWVGFTKKILLIVFDVGLIYMIYRFTKGND